MGSLAVIESGTLVNKDQWVERGRSLAKKRQDIDWQIGDWMVEGKDAGYINQGEFDYLSTNLGISPKRLKEAAKVALAFPPSLRNTALSVDHHAAVVSLPQEDALPLLNRASKEKLKVQDLKEAATKYRYDHAQLFEEDDIETAMCTVIVRAWNRSPKGARELFMDLAGEEYGIIDEDAVINYKEDF